MALKTSLSGRDAFVSFLTGFGKILIKPRRLELLLPDSNNSKKNLFGQCDRQKACPITFYVRLLLLLRASPGLFNRWMHETCLGFT